jgi:hypothetical protein
VETYKHLLWECRESKRVWQLFNEFATSVNLQEEKVIEYENIYKIGNIANMNKVKVKVIQGMIQMERPTNWTKEKIEKIAKDIRQTELYNARKQNKKLDVVKTKWEFLKILI